MAEDTRKVHTDALETLGSIIDENEKRDAIHLAVIPVKAKVKLYPGQDVGADGDANNPVGIVDPFLKSPVFPDQIFWLVIYPRQITSLRHVWDHPAFPKEENEILKTFSVKIVPNFQISEAFEESQSDTDNVIQNISPSAFNPNNDTEIPFITPVASALKEKRIESMKYIKDLAYSYHLSFEEIMDGAANFVRTGEYIDPGMDEKQFPDVPEEFWDHFETLTSVKILDCRKGNFIECCC